MFPVAATVPNNVLQTPLVNTVTPGTTTVHVPYDNVAPAVSSAPVDPNARGNNVPEQTAANEAEAQAQNDPEMFVNAPSTFIAQLVGQGLSNEVQTFLAQYEKLVAASIVKYKPSYAFKPSPASPDVFAAQNETPHAAPAAAPAAQAAHPSPAANDNPAPEFAAQVVTAYSASTARIALLADGAAHALA